MEAEWMVWIVFVERQFFGLIQIGAHAIIQVQILVRSSTTKNHERVGSCLKETMNKKTSW
jgi:hypothetical protein